jgi:hypothetical protein
MNTVQRAEVEKLLVHIEEVTRVWLDTGMTRSNAILRSAIDIRNLLAETEVKGFMVGQRVLIGGCIGTVVRPENNSLPNTDTQIWVMNPLRGFASRYSVDNIKPLPNGQL